MQRILGNRAPDICSIQWKVGFPSQGDGMEGAAGGNRALACEALEGDATIGTLGDSQRQRRKPKMKAF